MENRYPSGHGYDLVLYLCNAARFPGSVRLIVSSPGGSGIGSAGPPQDEFAVANLADSADRLQPDILQPALPNDNGQHYRFPECTDLLD